MKLTLHKTLDQFGQTMLPYSIMSYNGSAGLDVWNYTEVQGDETPKGNTKCNTIEGTFEAGLFPKFMPENEGIRMYRRAFCRPVLFTFENKTVNKDGYEIYRYRTDKNFMASGDNYPNNKCYCWKGKCLPDGFSTLAPCYYNIPIVISQPHFYNADEKVLGQIEGMSPNMELHDSLADINPTLGIPLAAQLRIQVNLNVAENTLYKVKPFSNLMVPLIWLEMEVLPPSASLKFLMNLVLYVMPIFQTVLIWVLGLLGISMVSAAALIIFYFPPERRLEDPYGHRIGYSPILVLPLSSRLKDMRIS